MGVMLQKTMNSSPFSLITPLFMCRKHKNVQMVGHNITICSCEVQICMPPAQIFATFFCFCAEMWFSCTKMFHGEQKCVYYAQKYFALYTSNILCILRNNIVQRNAQKKNILRYVLLIFCAFCVTILYNTMHKKYFTLYVPNILYKNISCFIHLIFCIFLQDNIVQHTKMIHVKQKCMFHAQKYFCSVCI